MSNQFPTKDKIALALCDVEMRRDSFAAIVEFVDQLRAFARDNNIALAIPNGVLEENLFGKKNFTIDSVFVVVDSQSNSRRIGLYTPFGEVEALARDLSDKTADKIVSVLLAQKGVTLQPPIFVFNNGQVQHEKWLEPYKYLRAYEIWKATTQSFGSGLVLSHLPSALRNAAQSALCAQVYTQRPASNQ